LTLNRIEREQRILNQFDFLAAAEEAFLKVTRHISSHHPSIDKQFLVNA